MDLQLTNKTALVTAPSGGIGMAIASFMPCHSLID